MAFRQTDFQNETAKKFLSEVSYFFDVEYI